MARGGGKVEESGEGRSARSEISTAIPYASSCRLVRELLSPSLSTNQPVSNFGNCFGLVRATILGCPSSPSLALFALKPLLEGGTSNDDDAICATRLLLRFSRTNGKRRFRVFNLNPGRNTRAVYQRSWRVLASCAFRGLIEEDWRRGEKSRLYQ